MRVLFATSRGDDYLSACLWDGLQELFGWVNVSEAGYTPTLHSYDSTRSASWHVGGHRIGRCLDNNDPPYDVLILNRALLNDWDWGWVEYIRNRHLRSGGKIAWVEGGDGWNEISVPPFPVDGVFRREIALGVNYPYPNPVHHLTFAAPSRWLDGSDSDDRTWDIFGVSSVHVHSVRWSMMREMWQTQRKHVSISATGAVAEHPQYLNLLRSSKLALCPPGGANSDCMRVAEVVGCGAIPVFVGVPDKVRENWFTDEHAFYAPDAGSLPAVLDRALDSDLPLKRRALLDHVRKHHTTVARVKRMLEILGV